MALLNIDNLKKAGADALNAAKKSGANALEAAKKSAKEASDLASQKAKEASEKASQIAKETSEKASQAAKEAKEKASQAAKEASEWATQTAKDVTLWAQENENIQNAISKGKQAYLFVSDKTTNAVQIVGNKFVELKNDEQVIAAWEKASEVAGKVGQTSVKGLKVISGVQAVQDRKKSIQTKEEADALKAEVEATNEAVRDDMKNSANVDWRHCTIQWESFWNT